MNLNKEKKIRIVHKGLTSCGGSAGNMFGAIYRSGGIVCTIQSAFTSTSSLSSFSWTVSIGKLCCLGRSHQTFFDTRFMHGSSAGTHLYLSMLRSTKKRNLQWVYHTVSWGMPMIILVIALSFRALGTVVLLSFGMFPVLTPRLLTLRCGLIFASGRLVLDFGRCRISSFLVVLRRQSRGDRFLLSCAISCVSPPVR